jgi:quercetin dioxygenase-like cupin family protein
MTTVYRLEDSVQYQTDSVVSRVLMGGKGHNGTVTTFAFSAGEGLSEHSAPYDALVLGLDGKGVVTIAGEAHELNPGDTLIMPADLPHAVTAPENFKMLLIMIR